MARLIVAAVIYFTLMFILTFFIPTEINAQTGYAAEMADPNLTQLDTPSGGAVSSSFWDIGDNISVFFSFFTFNIYNPLDLPFWLSFIIGAINNAMAILLLYALIVLIRGGGDV